MDVMPDSDTVNVVINVPMDNKKNAFFGVPFEPIISSKLRHFCGVFSKKSQ